MEQIQKNQLSKKNYKIMKLTPYVFLFFIFSFIGWVLETIFCYCVLGKLLKRGFLNSPICPIYGTGALILTFYLDKNKGKRSYTELFFIFIVVFSFFEYLVGFVLDALFAARWWDYSDSEYNLNGRITVLNSFLWGVITIVFVRYIYPLTRKFKKKIIYKIPVNLQIVMCSFLLIGTLVDFVFSCIRYLT